MVFCLNHRVLVLLTALLFTMGGVMHGAMAAEMASDATMAVSEVHSSDDACDACDSGNGMGMSNAACQAVCAPVVILPTGLPDRGVSSGSHLPVLPADDHPGRVNSPDPYPPKSVS